MIPRHLMIGIAAMLAVALAMGLYAWRMRGRVTQAETPAEYTHPVAAPVQGPMEPVTLYVAYDDPGVLRAQSASIPLPAGRQERAQELLRALLALYLDKSSSHPLGPGAEVRDVYLVSAALASSRRMIGPAPGFFPGCRTSGPWQVLAAMWCTTEFTRDNGPLRVIPGSHRPARDPSDDMGVPGHGPGRDHLPQRPAKATPT